MRWLKDCTKRRSRLRCKNLSWLNKRLTKPLNIKYKSRRLKMPKKHALSKRGRRWSAKLLSNRLRKSWSRIDSSRRDKLKQTLKRWRLRGSRWRDFRQLKTQPWLNMLLYKLFGLM